jgi:hypothetical protein
MGRAPEEENEDWHAPAGFAEWRILHAEYVGRKNQDPEDYTMLAVHMRSRRNRKFTLRCSIYSDDYASLDAAMLFDGEPEVMIGKTVLMSTGAGTKKFMRSAPLPWIAATILDAAHVDSGASIRVRFDDDGSERNMRISESDAEALATACGGEEAAIGARVRYRVMPDDTWQWGPQN